jgi:hypothetical protein
VIRRLFWLVLGAVLGVAGYRRAAALTRSLRPAPGRSTGFAADVREGMALYLDRQAARAPSTLEAHARRGLPRGGGASPGERPPGTPRWPKGPATSSRGLGRAPSRTDELKDGR